MPILRAMAGPNDIEVFDRALLRQRRTRSAPLFSDADFLLERAAEDALDRLISVKRQFPLALEVGCHNGLFRRLLAAHPARAQIGKLVALDFTPAMAAQAGAPALVADEEALPIADASLNLAISLLSLQWTNDLPGALVQIRHALKPDGLFLGALIGGESLTELRQVFMEAEAECEGGVSPRVFPFVEVRTMGSLLQRAGFALPVVDVDRFTVHYSSPLKLMNDLRAMGATNIIRERSKKPLRRATLMRAMEIYQERFSTPEGKVCATFEIVHASGWAPDASQQQPLKPGSATARLADALSAREMSAGEKPDI